MMESETRDQSVIPLPATNGPRPYRCEVCQRSFREVATLRKHEQLHRADRPYICNTCGKSFLWSSNLKVHERVHTGERPYKCKICHRCFTQSNDLRRHERNVHMRGKLYSYKNQSGRQPLPPPAVAAAAAASAPAHMNLAAYQAFALQQRAILQHALTYESFMQNAGAVTTSQLMQRMSAAHMSMSRPKDGDLAITTSTPSNNAHDLHDDRDENQLPQKLDDDVKLEQISPPPRSFERPHNTSTSQGDEHEPEFYRQSPGRSAFSPTSSKSHSPPPPSLSTYGLVNGHRSSAESPESQKDERPQSHESHHMDYRKYFSYPDYMSRINDLPRGYASAFNMATVATGNGIDSVMDLSVNKSVSSLESDDAAELDWKARHPSSAVPSSKSPVSESESESKRDVTTTSSETPTADSGIHHCAHCNIFFHDFTMFNLHQSLHSPVEEDPFMCPSCLKHCQDRIEFMFHIVWHVKYPHTIPRYQTFKETYLVKDS